ncbi:DNA mismatch repair protein MutT [Radiobacillus kanasensis]|uniref:DNA mismatch repair protein MutT n=1 Tax=Radiobacillus kanasensis TaxID=2844358 RepID=UPI001E367495|nr:DNA mismatch repair protein MutT [Radiobacillus kanasensis]UFT98360.1 DNA mismatch repair protein MutT [Radiobacillus kanasensis]
MRINCGEEILHVCSFQYVRSSSFQLENGLDVLNIVFLCEIETGEPYPKSPDEVEAIYWMTTEEIMKHPNAPIWLKESIQEAEEVINL